MSGVSWDVKFDWKDSYVPGVEAKVEEIVASSALAASGFTQAAIVGYGLVDTGRMLNSTRPEPESTLTWRVVVGTYYAVYLHEGHRIVAWGHDTGKYYLARPFLRDGMNRVKSVFYEAMRKAIG